MDEHLFEAVQISAWVFLFIFALSFGLYQYNHVDAVIDMFVDINMFNGREDATDVYLDPSEIERYATRAEVIMSVLNLPDTVNQTGNEEYFIRIFKDGSQYLDIHECDHSNGYRGVEITGTDSPFNIQYFLQGISASDTSLKKASHLINRLTLFLGGNADTKYSVDYSSDRVIYRKR